MIASKLFLFFCFYLLLLDNSLGQESLVDKGKNSNLFQNAIGYGKKYGGELRKLGSQWTQLLIDLVQAKRKVGLGTYQLARCNDSATEEVGPVINDNYADKVAELVAIRTQDIGTTQQCVDELEILKNEIALTMIVKMEKIEEQFKEKNVRRKVKEAKENGITDTDIKELLFADFFDSGGGLPIIDAADKLLSSFRDGMENFLDENYWKEFGIIQSSNGGSGDGYFENLADEIDDPYRRGGHENGGRDNGAAGEGGAAGGGDAPGGPPSSTPSGLPDDEGDDDEGDEDEGDDDELDDEEDIESINFFQEFRGDDEPTVEGLEMAFFRQTGGGEDEGETQNNPRGPPQFSVEQQNRAIELINSSLSSGRARVDHFETQARLFEHQHNGEFGLHPTLRSPLNGLFMIPRDRLVVHRRRANYYNSLWESARCIYDDYLNFRHEFLLDYDRTRQNFYYYGHLVGGNLSAINRARLPNSRPDELAQFSANAEADATRYLISRTRLEALIDMGKLLRTLFDDFRLLILSFKYAWKNEQARIAIIETINQD